MITIQNLSFSYPKSNKRVLNSLNLRFIDGMLNVIVGLNGAGKTTLFDIMTNLYKYNTGEIQNLPSLKDTLYQVQGGFFSPLIKGKDYLRLIFKISNSYFCNDPKVLLKFDNERERELFNDLWDKRLGDMSVGERRWLYITALTHVKRKLYIFDEPTSGVDPSSRIKIYKRLENMCCKKNTLVIISTHHLHELEFVNCNMVVLHSGKNIFSGSFQEFLNQYKSLNPDTAFERAIETKVI